MFISTKMGMNPIAPRMTRMAVRHPSQVEAEVMEVGSEMMHLDLGLQLGL